MSEDRRSLPTLKEHDQMAHSLYVKEGG